MTAVKALDEHAGEALAGRADEQAIEFEGRWHDWGQIKRVADQVHTLLRSAGVHDCGPVAFAPRNRPVAIAAELGMIAARKTTRMVYAFHSPRDSV